MAVAVQLDFEGATLTLTDSGLRVVDVWETREQFDTFAAEKIGPLSAQAGITAPPQLQFFEVHDYFTPGP